MSFVVAHELLLFVCCYCPSKLLVYDSWLFCIFGLLSWQYFILLVLDEGIGDTEGVCEDKEALDDSQDTGHGSVSPACHCVLKAQQYCHEKYSNNRGIVAKVLDNCQVHCSLGSS